MLGAGLMRELKARIPNVIFEGIAGPRMQAVGCTTLFPMEKLSVMGLVEVVSHLPEVLSIRRSVRNHFLKNPPDIFIGIDGPDFNLSLERDLKKVGITTVHYVCPSVWAWRSGRVNKIRQSVDMVLSLFPFEKEFLEKHSVPAVHVGHPLADEIPMELDQQGARERLGLDSGSSRIRGMFEEILNRGAPNLHITLVDGNARDVLQSSDAVLVASGTATLEALLLKRPMVIAYRLHWLTHWIFTTFKLIKSPFISLANMLAGKEIAPELLQDSVQPQVLAEALIAVLEAEEKSGAVREVGYKVHQELRLDASSRAAEAVLGLIRSKQAIIG